MVLPKLLTTQMISKHEEMVQQLQQEARMLFYDRMMYEINDSLTSILAVCDVEGKVSIPKIKQCIERINESLNNTKNYQNNFTGRKMFDIKLVLNNLVRVLKDNSKDFKIACFFSDIKAPAQGCQARFEELFLHILVNMFKSNEAYGRAEAIVELRQKDQNAVITVIKEDHKLSEETLKQINKIKKEEDFKGSLQIKPKGSGVEVIVYIPLQFNVVKISELSSERQLNQRPKETTSKQSAPQNIWDRHESDVAVPRFAY